MLTYKINYSNNIVMIYLNKKFIGRIVHNVGSRSHGYIDPMSNLTYYDIYEFYTGRKCNWNNPNTHPDIKAYCVIGIISKIEEKYKQSLEDGSLLEYSDGWGFCKNRKPCISERKRMEEIAKVMHKLFVKLISERGYPYEKRRYGNIYW